MVNYNVFNSGPRKGQPKTLKDRVIRFLTEDMKFEEVFCRSGKYRQFNPTKEGSLADPIFVGTKGAVRTGKCASNSYSISHIVHPLVKEYDEKLNKG